MDGSGHDLFGLALTEYWEGRRDAAFSLRRDDGQVMEDPLARYFAENPWPEEQALVAKISGTVLDLGCGAGRYLLWCQSMGFKAIGVDISKRAVQLCRERGAEQAHVEDITDPSFAVPAFDTGLLFGNNIGIGGTLAGTTALLSRLRSAVRPEGRVLVTSRDVRMTDNATHLAYHARNRAADRPIGQLTLQIQYDRAEGAWFDWLHPLPEELERAAAAASWQASIAASGEDGSYTAVLRPV